MLQHEVHRSAQLVSQGGQGFGLVHALLELFDVAFGFVVVTNKQHGGFGERPLQMGVADFVALGTVDLASGFGFALHQSGVGRELLNRLEPLNVTDFVQNGQRQNASYSGNGFQHVE